MVTRLDRLARSTRDLLNTLAAVAVQEGRIPVPWRHMGRYHDRPRSLDADGPRRPGGVRARADPFPDRGRPRTRQGAGRENGTEAETHPAPDPRGCRAARQRRNGAGYRSDLQRQSQYDFEAGDQARVTCNVMARQGEALMPIRREYRWFYPIDWPQLSAAIRFGRAKGRCEHCRRPHGRLVFTSGMVGGGTTRRPLAER